MFRRWVFLTIALSSACGHGGGEPQGPIVPLRRGAALTKPTRNLPLPGLLAAHRFAEVKDVIGPYVGRDGDLALAAWAEASGSRRNLIVTTIDAQGRPAEPKTVGAVGEELDLVLVRGFGASSAKLPGRPRFALITTRRREQKTQIDLAAISAAGAAVWGPTTLVERSARVLWVGFVTTGDGSLVLWAEQASAGKRGEAASVYALPISVDGRQQSAQLVSGKACVWQIAEVGAQAALASVEPSGGSCSSGSVSFDVLGPSGKSTKSVKLGGRAGLDLDLAGTPAGFVLAWSDHSQLEPRVMTAVVDTSGALRAPPASAVPGLGEQAVVALTAGSTAQRPAFLVWENMAERPEGARYFEISSLDANGHADGFHSRLLYGRADGGAPEIVAHAGGIAALTLAPACIGDGDCQASLPVPTFVALDPTLHVKASQPLVLQALGGRAADLGWGLTCGSAGCFALAAPSRSPASLFAVPLPSFAAHYRAAAEDASQPGKPRVVSSDVVARADGALAQLAVSETAGRTLVGYVTDFDPTTPWQKLTKPAEDGRFEPLRARVAVRPWSSAAGAPLAEEQVVSLRAHSLAGLCLLTGPNGPKEQVALWAGLDRGEPQVFITLLGDTGKRLQQRMLTRKPGDVSDVTGLALDGGGYLAAWVDQRSGDAEVYASRLGRSLEKAGPEQRITSADGAAAELALTRIAGKPYAIWSDARNADEPGWADIYGAFLALGDGARDGSEHRLTSTRQHSFAPHVSELAGVTLLAWLEEGAPASVRIAPLSQAGEVAGTVQVIPLEMGAPRALGFECGASACRVAITVESEGAGELYGFEWKPGTAAPNVKRLSGLGAAAAAAVAPLVRGEVVYVADLRDGRGLVRRLGVEW